MNEIRNPILPGFYPDPSICRVGDDYYMVTSSFSFFPGVPIFHSRDLKHWEQLGHVLDRVEQLPLKSRIISGGIFAPTIRWHEGTFYMIVTNVTGPGNFICTAKDPAGPWSELHVLENAPGIDPSLFWDEDGTCYMCGTQGGIWGAVLDTESFTLGERKPLWKGALVNCWAPEAPHIYKKDGWYYLIIAEGGTEHYHAVTIARSREPLGEYTGYEGNPIVTHRHLGVQHPIANTGHADLVQTQTGEWYMVLLASRPYGGYHKNLGRETFITPVDWSDEWPVVNPSKGMVEMTCPAPQLPEHPFPAVDQDDPRAFCWNWLGTPDNEPVTFDGRDVLIRCVAAPMMPTPEEDPAYSEHALGFYGRRQQHMSFTAHVHVTVPAEEGVSGGLMVLQNDFTGLRVELTRQGDSLLVKAVKSWLPNTPRQHLGRRLDMTQEPLGELILPGSEADLTLRAEGQQFTFLVNGSPLCTADGSFMGSESAYGFVGAYIGMFASGNGRERGCSVRFSGFRYIGQD